MGRIEAVLHTERLRGDVGRGITVRTNDPARPSLFLVIRAVVLTSVEIWPFEEVRISNRTSEGARASLLVRRDPTEEGELRVESLRAGVPWLRVTTERLAEPRAGRRGLPLARAGDWIVDIAVGASPEYGQRETEIRFRSGLPREPEVTVPVLLDIAPPVSLSSESVTIPWPAQEGETAATLLASVRGDLDPATLRIESEPKSLVLAVSPAGPRHFRIEARWKGRRSPRGAIVFRAGDETLRVPVGVAPR